MPICIPDYQRDYSWRASHVQDLLTDLRYLDKQYLMGTIILHENSSHFDIVDGQQRLVTLTVLVQELYKSEVVAKRLPLLKACFSEKSAQAISRTLNIIRETLKTFEKNELEQLKSLLNIDGDETRGTCLLFSVITLRGVDALDRAYTFFDSVNSKGKPLSDHDLLKAHHLMYIPDEQESLATEFNHDWIGRDAHHQRLFSTMLRRIRMWARNEDRDHRYERPDYDEFQAMAEPDIHRNGDHVFNRYLQPVAFRSWRRVGGRIVLSMDYPVAEGEDLLPIEITQSIEGGDAFFLYARRYHKLFAKLFEENPETCSTDLLFVRELSSYIANNYIRDAFQAIMLLHVDKFGEDKLVEIAACIERLISEDRWSQSRLTMGRVFTRVRDCEIVLILLNAVSAHHVLSQILLKVKLLPTITDKENISGVRKRYLDNMNEFYAQKNVTKSIPSVAAVARTYLAQNL